MNGKRRWLFAGLLLTVLAITGCSFLHNAEKIATAPDPGVGGPDAGTQAEPDAAEEPASLTPKAGKPAGGRAFRY